VKNRGEPATEAAPLQKQSAYARLESHLLKLFPAFISPLRFRLLAGYIVVLMLGLYGWEQIASAWRYVVTLLAPVTALLGALLALKLSVVIVSIFTLLSALFKLFFGFLMVVLKPGIFKAIFIPQLLALVNWFHRKSSRMQVWARAIYDKAIRMSSEIINWWRSQKLSDKMLLAGFLIPLFLVLVVVFVVKRAIAIFAFKKLTEQIVQKSTKYVIKNFHRLPVVGGLPAFVTSSTKKLTRRTDRSDVVEDLKNLRKDLYRLNQSQNTEKPGG